jgi:hypothetical protein
LHLNPPPSTTTILSNFAVSANSIGQHHIPLNFITSTQLNLLKCSTTSNGVGGSAGGSQNNSFYATTINKTFGENSISNNSVHIPAIPISMALSNIGNGAYSART